jgi:hypothetical protein
MDKGLMLKILVVFLALLFILEPLAMSVGSGGGGGSGNDGEVYVGAANVNATIYGYGAFLYAQGPTQLQLAQIRGNAEVLEVEDVGGGAYRITLRDSAKTREVYSEFKEAGIETVAIAQVGLPGEYEVHLADGNALSVSGGYQQLVMEPVMEPGSIVSYVLRVQTDGASTLGILEAQTYTYEVELEIPGVVDNSDTSTYEFSVPWGERGLNASELEAEYGEGSVEYARKDYILFEPPLDAGETMFMKKDYMNYISASSASVSANFTDSSLVEADFGERAVLPDSILSITSDGLPELGYEYSSIKKYAISLPESVDGYLIGASSINLTSEEDFSEGDEVVLRTSAVATGNVIIAVSSMELEAA